MNPPEGRRPLAVRLYGVLTGLLPGELGRRYAQEATQLFEQLHADAVRNRGVIAGWLLWGRNSWSLVACALRERRELQTGRRRRRGGGDSMETFLHDVRHAVRALVDDDLGDAVGRLDDSPLRRLGDALVVIGRKLLAGETRRRDAWRVATFGLGLAADAHAEHEQKQKRGGQAAPWFCCVCAATSEAVHRDPDASRAG